MTYAYAFQGFNKEKMAKVLGRDLPISPKQSIEICSYIRGKNLQRAKVLMEDAIALRKAIPLRRYNGGAGHKRGMGPGRYAVNAATDFLMLLNSVEANAQQKGLDTANLIVIHACANFASRPMKYGRKRGVKSKRAHVEIVVEERPEEKKEKRERRPQEKKAQKQEKPAHTAGPKAEQKTEPKQHVHNEPKKEQKKHDTKGENK